MAKPKITTKNLDLISELLMFEELAYKKCAVYAKALTNPTLSANICQIAENHKARYESLLSYLNSHE